MTANPQQKLIGIVAGAVLALGATTALAAAPAPKGAASDPPIVLAQSRPSTSTAVVVRTEEYPAMQRSLLKARAEGPDALRHYVWRTRTIYNWYIVDFALPAQ